MQQSPCRWVATVFYGFLSRADRGFEGPLGASRVLLPFYDCMSSAVAKCEARSAMDFVIELIYVHIYDLPANVSWSCRTTKCPATQCVTHGKRHYPEIQPDV